MPSFSIEEKINKIYIKLDKTGQTGHAYMYVYNQNPFFIKRAPVNQRPQLFV